MDSEDGGLGGRADRSQQRPVPCFTLGPVLVHLCASAQVRVQLTHLPGTRQGVSDVTKPGSRAARASLSQLPWGPVTTCGRDPAQGRTPAGHTGRYSNS